MSGITADVNIALSNDFGNYPRTRYFREEVLLFGVGEGGNGNRLGGGDNTRVFATQPRCRTARRDRNLIGFENYLTRRIF